MISYMSVVLLDPRFPDMIPVDALPHLRGEIRYTDEVGVHLRWVVSDIADRASQDEGAPGGAHREVVLISSDENDDLVQAAIARGETVYRSAYHGGAGEGAVSSLSESPLSPGGSSREVPAHLEGIHEALEVMRRALTIGAWERKQTHESLLPYLDEEAAEFADAVREYAPGDTTPTLVGDKHLQRELGDVLLQVLFHAEIAARRGAFEFDAVARSFVAKMRSRSPYLFDGTDHVVDEGTQVALWEAAKAKESEPFDPLTADASLLPPLEPRGLLDLPDIPGLTVD